MGKISGVVTAGGSPVEGAKVMLVKDTEAGGQLLGMKTTNATGEYSFIHTILTSEDVYHVLCEHEAGGLYYQALSCPFILPEVSVEADNFTPIAGEAAGIGWDLEALPSTGFAEGTMDVPI